MTIRRRYNTRVQQCSLTVLLERIVARATSKQLTNNFQAASWGDKEIFETVRLHGLGCTARDIANRINAEYGNNRSAGAVKQKITKEKKDYKANNGVDESTKQKVHRALKALSELVVEEMSRLQDLIERS